MGSRFFLFYGLLAEFEDFEDTEAFFAGGEGRVSGLGCVKKCLTFGSQGFFPDRADIDGFAFRLVGHGEAVLPVDRVRIKNQLCFYGFRVVEDEHPVIMPLQSV